MARKNSISTFLVQWIVMAIGVSFAIALVPGIHLPQDENTVTYILVFSGFLGLINVTLKPIVKVLSLPATILTLGIFALVVNTGLFYLAGMLATSLFAVPLTIDSFGSAFVASIIISIVNMLLGNFFD